ncbi:unnamed protein product, partial [Ectocarpus fasciculatus]
QGGESGNPFIITGGRDAVVNAGDDEKVVYVQHSWVTLEISARDREINGLQTNTTHALNACTYQPTDAGCKQDRKKGVVGDVGRATSLFRGIGTSPMRM